MEPVFCLKREYLGTREKHEPSHAGNNRRNGLDPKLRATAGESVHKKNDAPTQWIHTLLDGAEVDGKSAGRFSNP
jgi:hypothetical protein